MGNSICDASIELNLPADRALMLVVRLTTAGVIARAGVTIDRMDEIKMAVEEACGCLMEQINPPGRIELRFQVQKGQLMIRATALDAENRTGDVDDAALEVMGCILDALVDRADFEVRDGFISAVELRAAL